MENRGPAAFKYDTGGSNKGFLVAMLIISGLLTTVAAANISNWFAWGVLIPIGIVIYLIRSSTAKSLLIGPRYVIVGDAIIYYATVARACLNRKNQTLTLFSERGRQVVIAAERFPTNARKDFKIKANRTAKFEKVTQKIVQRLKGITPEITG